MKCSKKRFHLFFISIFLPIQLIYSEINFDSIPKVEMGLYSQKEITVTGAISTVSGIELDKSPVSTLSLSLNGILSGLSAYETSSTLTKEEVFLQIRTWHTFNGSKKPLIIIDGVIATSNIYESITPSEIQSISVLKDASTQAIYGLLGANGVIIITTKRGEKGALKINVSLENSIQKVTTKPTFINSWEYATLRNQASINDGAIMPFTSEQISYFKSNTDSEKYPNTNWYNLFMNDIVMQQRANVSLSGGNDKAVLFANVNFVNQGSQFITESNKYNASDAGQIFNFRANIDVSLFNNLSAYYRTSGNIKREKSPAGKNSSDVYQSLFSMPSTTYGPLSPNNQVVATSLYNDPTYGILNKSGFGQLTSANTINQFGMNMDLSSIISGLELGGFAAFETYGIGNLVASQDYERWTRTSDLDNLEFTKKGDEVNSPLSYSKSSTMQYQLIFNSYANYSRCFGKNEINSTLFAAHHHYSSPETASPFLYPYKHILSGLMVNYNYDNRYFTKIDVGYSGSDQFPNSNRFFATPALSVGWIISNENFLTANRFLTFMKVRGSYGYTANDDFGASRYTYLDDVIFVAGGSIANLQNIIEERGYKNTHVTPEMIRKKNIGIDIELYNSLIINFDHYKEHVDNMYINSTTSIPIFQGIPLANYPYTNSGKMKNEGFEFSTNYVKQYNNGLKIVVGGLINYSKNTLIDVGEVELAEDYAYRYRSQGYSYGQEWGYLVDKSNGNGYYNTAEELVNSEITYSFGTPRLGDLIYKDLNGDKIIDIKDQAPIGDGLLPKIQYSLSGSVLFKNIDISFLFQGVGKYEVIEAGYGVDETLLDGIYSDIHKNAWTTERYENNETITFPALSVNTSTNKQPSNFYKNDRAYLRLRNIEVGYTLPVNFFRKLDIKEMRIFASGRNLLTFDNMKYKDFGPEGNYISIPVYKIINVGFQLKF